MPKGTGILMPMGIKILMPMGIRIQMPSGIRILTPMCIRILMPMGIKILMHMGIVMHMGIMEIAALSISRIQNIGRLCPRTRLGREGSEFTINCSKKKLGFTKTENRFY